MGTLNLEEQSPYLDVKVRLMSIKVVILKGEKLAIGKKPNDVLSLIVPSEPDEKLVVFDSQYWQYFLTNLSRLMSTIFLFTFRKKSERKEKRIKFDSSFQVLESVNVCRSRIECSGQMKPWKLQL